MRDAAATLPCHSRLSRHAIAARRTTGGMRLHAAGGSSRSAKDVFKKEKRGETPLQLLENSFRAKAWGRRCFALLAARPAVQHGRQGPLRADGREGQDIAPGDQGRGTVRPCSTRGDLCALPTWWLLRGRCTRSHSEPGREMPQRRWYFVSRRGRVGRCQVCKTQKAQSSISSDEHRTDPCSRPHKPKNPGFPGRSSTTRARSPQAQQTAPAPRTLTGHATRASRQPQYDAGWSSPVARQAHNLKVAGSNPAPATSVS